MFVYPLKGYEIHKWLIGKKITLHQVEKILGKLIKKRKIQNFRDYFFLPGKKELVSKRLKKEKQSLIYFRKAKFLVQALKLVPSIKLVGISGGLALNNASKHDDIDLFIITSKDRLWLSRLSAILILGLLGARRKARMSKLQTQGKLCLNILLEEDKLEQVRKDVYVAHEVLQMKVLWQRSGVYQKYLEENLWAFKFLPNWFGNSDQVVSSKYYVLREKTEKSKNPHNTILNLFESLAKKFQLMVMGAPKGMERIEDGALYFHPNDIRKEILVKYRQKLAGLDK